MSRLIQNIQSIETYQQLDSVIHRLHPSAKIVITFSYIVTLVSFGRYDCLPIIPLILYPAVMFAASSVPISAILLRVIAVQPFVIAVGIFNPLFDSHTERLFGHLISSGWFTFISILLKSTLAVTSALLLFAVTGMNNIAHGLRVMFIPKLFVLQLVLTYRYIGVLMEEISRSLTAYQMRSFRKGLQFSEWGSMPGHILLRSIERAERVYAAMCLRGFDGEYNIGSLQPIRFSDIMNVIGWLLFFVSIRYWNVTQIAGTFIQGVITK